MVHLEKTKKTWFENSKEMFSFENQSCALGVYPKKIR
jgi:hypothetical protein